MTNAPLEFARKTQENRQLGRYRRKWENNITANLKEIRA
jgi:hypothetical protein